MTKKAYRKLIAGHLQWSLVGLIIALFVAFISSDHRSVVYGMPAADSGMVKGLAFPPFTAPATAPGSTLTPKEGIVIPDTVNGVLVWPDPWDQITDTDRPFY